MSISPEEHLRRVRSKALDQACAVDVKVTAEALTVTLSDGRVLSVPLDWFPRLTHATPAERRRWEFHGDGEAIWWEDLDDGVEVAHLLVGWKSGEGPASLKRWLDERAAKKKRNGKQASA
jgi:Protein of unknown function (DUF2442)